MVRSSAVGTAPYTYAWSQGPTAEDLTNVCAGVFTVTATDANGCTGTATVTITEPPVLTAAIVGTNVSCNGACDGAGDLTPGGGTPPYTFLWDDPGATTTEDVAALCAGTYNVTVTDANGCTQTANVVITEPTLIVLTPSSTNSN